MRVLLVGALGRMGKEVVSTAKDFEGVDVVKEADARFEKEDETHYKNVCDVKGDFDGIIDFSAHNATISTLKVAIVRRVAVVICATGHSAEEIKYIEYASKFIPVFKARNTSVGMALMRKFVREIASKYPYADVEIIETHHTRKADVPSGSALSLANEVVFARGGRVCVGRRVDSERTRGEIGIHSLRMGDETGKHEVIFDTGDEIITLSHKALSRSLYARGAIEALKYISTKEKGLYGVDDLL